MSAGIQTELMLRDAGKLRATASVTIPTEAGPLTLLGVKVIESEPGKPWVALPSSEWMKDGKKQYQKVIEMPRPAMRALSETVLAEYSRALEGK